MEVSKNNEIFEKMSVAKAVQTMAIPTIIGQLIILFYNVADTFFVGQTNNPYMVAGASLILPIYNISLSISGLAGIGGGALISRLLGEKRIDEAKKACSFSIYIAIFSALFFSIMVLLFMRPLLFLLGAGSNTYHYASEYAFCVIVLGGLPTVLSNTLSTLLRSTGESKKAGFGITMGGLINIALDPLFMFIIFPSGKEILGAGIATCISNCIACAYFIIVIYRLRKDSVLTLYSLRTIPQRKSIMEIFSIGVPSAIATLLFDLDYMVLGRLMASYGDIPLAAIGIVLKVERLPLNIGIGICQGMMPIVAYNYTANNLTRMKETINFSRRLGLICAAISIILYEIFSTMIMNFFIADMETVTYGAAFLRVRCLATPLMFMSFFTVNLFNGFGRGQEALFLGVTRWLVFNIPMLFILNIIIGMYGLVWSQITADILTVCLSLYVYKKFERTLSLQKSV